MRSPVEPGVGSLLALAALVALALLAPWPFGGVTPVVLAGITASGLLVAAAALATGALRGGIALPATPLWPLAGFVGLALCQLVPLPRALLALLAPGPAAVWHPTVAAAAAVLGPLARPVSLDPHTTLRAAGLTAALGLLAALAAPALSRARTAAVTAGLVAGAGFLLSAYAILARARFGALLYGTIAVPTVSPFGTFVNKNHFAGWTAMAALVAAGLVVGLVGDARAGGRDWTAGRRALPVVLSLVAALAMALAVLASLSRGGAVALAAGVAALGLWRPGRRVPSWRALVPKLALGLGLGVLVFALAPPEAHVRLRSLAGSSFRLDTWRGALRLAASSPFVGSGLGSFHDAYPRFKQDHGLLRVEHAESDYLETLAETGAAGLALALCALALLLRGAGAPPALAAGPLVRGVSRGGAAALVALAVHSALDFDLRIPSNAALAALAAALAAGRSGARARPLGRAGAAALALACAALLAALATLPDRPWLAAREEARLAATANTPAVRALRLARAEDVLALTLRARPAHAESWLMLAGAQSGRGDPATAAALARHAAGLDPERAELVAAAARIEAAAAAAAYLDRPVVAR